MFLFEISVVVLSVLTTGLLAWWWMTHGTSQGSKATPDPQDPITFLFDHEVLHHATGTASAAYAMGPGTHYWGDLRDALRLRFPDFPDHPNSGEAGQTQLRAVDGDSPQEARISWRGDLCWVTLTDPARRSTGQASPKMIEELATLRRVNETAPSPAWEEDAEGHITWYNPAYETLYRRARAGQVSTQKALFSKRRMTDTNRVQIATGPDGAVDWYALTAVASDDTTLYHATHITAVVKAEESQRNFVQTLAKTFAHLSIGLAIFDRNRQLALFNPALVDLTGLQAQFLSAKPDMLSFFDQLREKRKMPEPKNYLNWRDEIADVIAAADNGKYEETWSLETGQTYSVKGRPHPDGATAFLIEDISAEMTLTRSFRAELEQAQMMLDKIEDAIAIFSPTGVLTFSNAAFQTLWRIEPDTAFADITLQDCAKIWKTRARSGADIHAIERFVSDIGSADPDDMILRLGDETMFRGKMMPVAAGSTMVRFYPTREADQRLKESKRKLAQ